MTPISVRPTRLILSTLAILIVATAPRSMAQASDAGAPAVRFPANMILTGTDSQNFNFSDQLLRRKYQLRFIRLPGYQSAFPHGQSDLYRPHRPNLHDLYFA